MKLLGIDPANQTPIAALSWSIPAEVPQGKHESGDRAFCMRYRQILAFREVQNGAGGLHGNSCIGNCFNERNAIRGCSLSLEMFLAA